MSSNNKIAVLNDHFRSTGSGGRVMLSTGVSALDLATKNVIIGLVKNFTDFNQDNDPHGEHDFGAVSQNEIKVFWKIDYYDSDYRYMSENPSDPKITNRVLTLLLVNEW